MQCLFPAVEVQRWNESHYRIADFSYGLLGRSPEHVASFVTGMSLRPEVFGRYADDITGYHRHMSDNDIFAAYAVLPPQAARNPKFFQRRSLRVPTLRVLVGLATKSAQASGSDRIPSVMETLGRLASLEALLAGVIGGQISMAEDWPTGFVTFNRRMIFAALNWCTENHSPIIDCLRDLCGGGVFQTPADASVMEDPKLCEIFEAYRVTPPLSAGDRMKLFDWCGISSVPNSPAGTSNMRSSMLALRLRCEIATTRWRPGRSSTRSSIKLLTEAGALAP